MVFEVSQEALEKTTCSSGYTCLNEDVEAGCEVIRKVVSGVLHTLCAGKPYCFYCQSVKGIEGYCWCAVRVELYDKYGI